MERRGGGGAHLCVPNVLAADGTPKLPHEGLELAEALQHGLVREEADVLDMVVGLVLFMLVAGWVGFGWVILRSIYGRYAGGGATRLSAKFHLP